MGWLAGGERALSMQQTAKECGLRPGQPCIKEHCEHWEVREVGNGVASSQALGMCAFKWQSALLHEIAMLLGRQVAMQEQLAQQVVAGRLEAGELAKAVIASQGHNAARVIEAVTGSAAPPQDMAAE